MPIPVKYIKIKNKRYHGYVENGEVIVEQRLIGKKRLEINIHEGLHFKLPYLTEDAIEDAAADIARMLWADGYRKYDNDESVKLQDENL